MDLRQVGTPKHAGLFLEFLNGAELRNHRVLDPRTHLPNSDVCYQEANVPVGDEILKRLERLGLEVEARGLKCLRVERDVKLRAFRAQL
jgi:hypothetical protein